MKSPTNKIHWLQARGLFPYLNQSPGIELMVALASHTTEIWNHEFPVGTPVWCYRTYGDETTAFQSVTTSAARVENGHTAFVDVHGQPTPMVLTHVTPLLAHSEVNAQSNLITLKSCLALVLPGESGKEAEA